jgi:hypothetical protein
MAYSVTDILGSINKNGWLSSSKFIVRFSPPAILSNSGNITEILSIRAEDCRLPGVTYMATDVNRYGLGPMQKMPYNVQFTDTSISFISDKNGTLYKYFYTWMNSIVDFSGTNNVYGKYETEYKDNYSTTISIDIYDNSGSKIQTVTFRDAFPISFNEIPLSWNQSSQLLKMVVNFSFRDWLIEDVPLNAPTPQSPAVQQLQPQSAIPTTTPTITESKSSPSFTGSITLGGAPLGTPGKTTNF